MSQNIPATEISVVALVKDGERFVFLYDKASVAATLKVIGRMAADPELNFTWYDAAVLGQKVRKLQRGEHMPMREPA